MLALSFGTQDEAEEKAANEAEDEAEEEEEEEEEEEASATAPPPPGGHSSGDCWVRARSAASLPASSCSSRSGEG